MEMPTPQAQGGTMSSSTMDMEKVQDKLQGLEIGQATQAATLAGAQATQAAAHAGTWSTMLAGAGGLLAGIFLGMAIAASKGR
jgi:chorismate synthase